MNGLSTHVLNTATGQPVAGLPVELFRQSTLLGSTVTDADGRCRSLLQEPLQNGIYRLVFHLADQFPDWFFPEVSITFVVKAAAGHHHVPLLISPFGFTTYRGS